MSRKDAPNRHAAGNYSSDVIAAMPLDQLRELSDLQLSERELADVIAAIHCGGAQVTESQADGWVYNDSEAYLCPLCQLDEQLSAAQCFACQEGTSSESVQQQGQLIAQWVSWYRQYRLWAASCQRIQPHDN